jgi:predicted site-specific integrase-resolvase
MKLRAFEAKFKDPDTGEPNRSAAARALGVSRQALYNWERAGGTIPKPFDRLAELVLKEMTEIAGNRMPSRAAN